MNIFGWILLFLGAIVIGMGLLDIRWGNAGWRVRLFTGLIVAAGGIYFLLSG